MMCFVVVYKGNCIIQQGMQVDDGTAAYKYAKEKGYSIRIWEMHGLAHFWELDANTKAEIKNFTKALR